MSSGYSSRKFVWAYICLLACVLQCCTCVAGETMYTASGFSLVNSHHHSAQKSLMKSCRIYSSIHGIHFLDHSMLQLLECTIRYFSFSIVFRFYIHCSEIAIPTKRASLTRPAAWHPPGGWLPWWCPQRTGLTESLLFLLTHTFSLVFIRTAVSLRP